MITKEILFDKDFLTIYFVPELKLIHVKWKGYANSDKFREGLLFALEAMTENHAENMLADLKLMQAILPQDEDWATQVWFPKLAQTTIRKLGIVTSLDYFNNTSVKRIVNTAVPLINFETRYFVDADQAKLWLANSL